MDRSIRPNDALHQDVPRTWITKAYEMKPLIFAESPQPCMKDLSLENYSAPLQAETWIFRAQRAQRTLYASGKWQHPCGLDRSKVYCFHTSSVIFLQLEAIIS